MTFLTALDHIQEEHCRGRGGAHGLYSFPCVWSDCIDGEAYTPKKNVPVVPEPAQPSMMPVLPDAEEQEALSQLLLAWYQAGYAAGRYASIRQRKAYSCLLYQTVHYGT